MWNSQKGIGKDKGDKNRLQILCWIIQSAKIMHWNFSLFNSKWVLHFLLRSSFVHSYFLNSIFSDIDSLWNSALLPWTGLQTVSVPRTIKAWTVVCPALKSFVLYTISWIVLRLSDKLEISQLNVEKWTQNWRKINYIPPSSRQLRNFNLVDNTFLVTLRFEPDFTYNILPSSFPKMSQPTSKNLWKCAESFYGFVASGMLENLILTGCVGRQTCSETLKNWTSNDHRQKKLLHRLSKALSYPILYKDFLQSIK